MAHVLALLDCYQRWGAFKVPFVSVIVLALLLTADVIDDVVSADFIYKVVLWIIGTTIIAYGHSLAWTTHRNHQGEEEKFKDLPYWFQALILALYLTFFVLFGYLVLS